MADTRPPWRCETCKHWTPSRYVPVHRPDLIGWGVCSLIESGDSCFEREAICCGCGPCDGREFADTHESFGCVLWEEKK